MKLVMIFLSICLSLSHQQYGGLYRTMFGVFPWVRVPPSYYLKLPFYNNLMDTSEDGEIGRMDLINNHQPSIDDEEEDFSDTESRAKGIHSYRSRPNYLNDPINARFLFNLFASTTNTFSNPLLKTATFTLTQTLSLTSVVRCVPIDQAIANPPTCARRRRHYFDGDEMEGEQYSIDPSETLGMVPTAALSSSLPQEDRSISDLISSTKDDPTISDEISKAHYTLRDKRFLINKNQFVVSSVVTTFAFVNTTITATVNLLNPLPVAVVPPVACVPGAPGATPVCVQCLPIGFIICPVAAG
ncbi:hypothetical protein DAPPUDRAFT_110178 [Daphnia pulex]|uniref:Uncharacterized protein n=1 Tax=Daphnia pulex TaxID=6669 RepID=E9H5Q8_DAPPU|nr:hypothetical protein DAPPUDRAFT_110178 [Daphnia pulex]|eukprot:EFX73044.1 hypothetical protein DAPPUDRAFT_110178 [Daphnia pulex]